MGLISTGLFGAGCGDSVPVNPKPADGSNPHVSGTPQERIKNIEADTSLTPEERARRIAVVKERNHLK
ncbi:hypothetical protein OP10G_0330 [Fimbriimonas ginsengisoli Gsoil 348]|uniref:Uncharacterized protein n=1 Tax=Fimbriimonas ginsengisoli Gsoil 348 TaxID=661478 RepID=A0A068NJB0_FIMGI|nr:hypothetical protein OP10G_0330 [Fimbriimonas ginsengisoli Gsoil 348]